MASSKLISMDGGTGKDLANLMDNLDKEFGHPAWHSLSEAIRSSNMETFCEQGPTISGRKTSQPKREAILAGRPDLLTQLLQWDSFIDEDVMLAACDCKDRPSISTLLSFGWPINHPLKNSSILCTAIHEVSFAQWLVESGADVNLRSRSNETALSLAIAYGSIDVVHLLLQKGTDTSHGDLLHCAAQREDEGEGASIVELLAQGRADVNAYRFNNAVALRYHALFKLPTPLHVACKRGNVPVARTLLRYGADPHRPMLKAMEAVSPSPYEIAIENGNRGLIELFVM